MGHAIHFLTRLERLEDEQHLELAKSLYRDSGLLAHVLGRARLPEGCDRAALSLGPGAGPYLVVTRDGGFVTCLGEGMTTGALPVIARAHLDALAAESQSLRERLALARELAGDHGEKRLFRRVFAGRYLSREEFLALSALQPIFARGLPSMNGEIGWLLEDVKVALIACTRRQPERLTHAQRGLLERAWNMVWACGHIALLAASGRRDALEEGMTAGSPSARTADSRRLFWPALTWGELGPSMRAGLAIAKIGKPCLAAAKRRWDSPLRPSDLGEGYLALQALGGRHRALQKEAGRAMFVKALRRMDDDEGRKQLAPKLHGVVDAMASAGERFLVDKGRYFYRRLARWLPAGSPHRFEKDEEIPDDLAIASLAAEPLAFRFSPEPDNPVVRAVAGAARRKPEDLYLPAEFAEPLRQCLGGPEAVAAWLSFKELLAPARKAEPVHVERTQAPNEACRCGSGKKFKRCCSLAAA